MELKEFLEQNPILQKMELADMMYPGLKSARTKLSAKLNEFVIGSGKQRILEKDEIEAKRALRILRDNINKYIEE